LLSVAMTAEFFVTLSYWALISYDPKLLAHSSVQRMSLDLDLSMHLLPFLVLYTDFMAFSRDFTRSNLHILTVAGYSLAYTVWVHVCYYYNGYWAYPMLGLMTPLHRGILTGLSMGLGVLTYEAMVRFHRRTVWSRMPSEVKEVKEE